MVYQILFHPTYDQNVALIIASLTGMFMGLGVGFYFGWKIFK